MEHAGFWSRSYDMKYTQVDRSKKLLENFFDRSNLWIPLMDDFIIDNGGRLYLVIRKGE